MDAALLRALGPALLDPWAIMDRTGQIVDFDSRFRSLFARHQARRLKGSTCCQFLNLSICSEGDHLPQKCEQGPVRYDEIQAKLEGDDRSLRLTVGAAPLPDGMVFVSLRDVTDIAEMQRKYRGVLDRKAQDQDDLREDIMRKTKELMDTNMELNRVQKDLMRFKKGLFG